MRAWKLVTQATKVIPLCYLRAVEYFPACAASLGSAEYLPGEFAPPTRPVGRTALGAPEPPAGDAQSLGGPEAAANPSTAQPELAVLTSLADSQQAQSRLRTAVPPAAFNAPQLSSLPVLG